MQRTTVILLSVVLLSSGCISQINAPQPEQPILPQEQPVLPQIEPQLHLPEVKLSEFPIKYWINETSGQGLLYFDQRTIDNVVTGADLWNKAVNVSVFLRVYNKNDLGPSDLIIQFTPLLREREAWGWYDSSMNTIFISPNLLSCGYIIAAHEFGHALGFEDVPRDGRENATDIMFYSQYGICDRQIKPYQIEAIRQRMNA